VRFVTRTECEVWFQRKGFGPDGPHAGRPAETWKAFDFLYDSPVANCDYITAALAGHFARSQDILFWPHGFVFGDGSIPPGRPGWQEYVAWRRTTGEDRPVYDAPGHLFQGNEQEGLRSAMRAAILLGWDTLVAARADRCALHLLHDYITVYARSAPSDLLRTLDALGLQRR
jgi:hypothetical protein